LIGDAAARARRPVARCIAQLRRLRYRDPETDKNRVPLTNHTLLPALTVSALCQSRWQVEPFFQRSKQHLRIKRCYGTAENAVTTQVWIVVSVYALVTIIKRNCNWTPRCIRFYRSSR